MHPASHQYLQLGTVKLLLQFFVHSILYAMFMLFIHLRCCSEHFCWCIESESHWRNDETGKLIIHPWHFRLIGYPAILIWKFFNRSLIRIEAVHWQTCDPETFELPSATYYSIGFDFNHN